MRIITIQISMDNPDLEIGERVMIAPIQVYGGDVEIDNHRFGPIGTLLEIGPREVNHDAIRNARPNLSIVQ